MRRRRELNPNKVGVLVIILSTLLFIGMAKCQARDWSMVTAAIAQVESKGNPRAVNGDAVGLLQIRPILVRDINRILKLRKSSKRYTLNDRYNPQKSREMFEIYQSYYNPSGSVERAIRLWNGGSGYTNKGTQGYYNKVRREMK
jgi:soluble lytic murein transglycosylase-like protein